MVLTLKDGRPALIDDADFPLVRGKSWSAHQNKNCVYVRSGRIYLHRLIADAKPGEIIDHINGDGLDNRRANLRVSNHQANKANQHFGKKTSKFIGVSKKSGKYAVTIKMDGLNLHCGTFVDEVAAAKHYDSLAIMRFGANALTNFA